MPSPARGRELQAAAGSSQRAGRLHAAALLSEGVAGTQSCLPFRQGPRFTAACNLDEKSHRCSQNTLAKYRANSSEKNPKDILSDVLVNGQKTWEESERGRIFSAPELGVLWRWLSPPRVEENCWWQGGSNAGSAPGGEDGAPAPATPGERLLQTRGAVTHVGKDSRTAERPKPVPSKRQGGGAAAAASQAPFCSFLAIWEHDFALTVPVHGNFFFLS